ncbi:hypothetical protein E2C01_082392 [Portunus trituberculatus]|uniref:Uncharacterized protein n=4 Tax=Portunus trituberculatus TaxID=210409 RepID=A0A5B7J1I5_PORTR|nr:hypothetical protein [Portunus trituberculatus]
MSPLTPPRPLHPPSAFSDSREMSEAECDRELRQGGTGGTGVAGQRARGRANGGKTAASSNNNNNVANELLMMLSQYEQQQQQQEQQQQQQQHSAPQKPPQKVTTNASTAKVPYSINV